MIERYNMAVARDRETVPASLANPIQSVTVSLFPPGAVNVRLHFGHGDPGRAVTQEGQTFEPNPDEAREGLFVSNDVGAAGTMSLDISFHVYREPIPVVTVGRSPASSPGGAWVNQLLRNFGLK